MAAEPSGVVEGSRLPVGTLCLFNTPAGHPDGDDMADGVAGGGAVGGGLLDVQPV